MIKLTEDNGSVPNAYYYYYELIYLPDGQASLCLKKGRAPEQRILINESKTINIADLENIRKAIGNFPTQKLSSPYLVGGGERLITIKSDSIEKVVEILPDDTNGIQLFNNCVRLYEQGLVERLRETIENT